MKSKKKDKTPLALRIVAWVFPKLEWLAPWLAERWFVSVFFRPLRYKMPPPELELIDKATKYNLSFNDKKIQVYEWGEGKPILFVHGWMGRAAQFRKFIPAFNQAGYKIVSFDATGHGLSEGNRSHILEFAHIIGRLAQRYDFKMVVGHSIGGAASMHALIENHFTDKLIMISSPTIAEKIVGEFLRRLNASQKVTSYFYDYVESTYGKPFEAYSASYIVKDLQDVDLLLIHDQDDIEVTIDNAEILLEKYNNATLYRTEGLGHTRILKDFKVIETTLKFAKNKRQQREVTFQ